MPSLLTRVTVLFLTTFISESNARFAPLPPTLFPPPPPDVCKSHKTLSDPWRNCGFLFSLEHDCSKNDRNLKEGWYSFSGIGGDRLVSDSSNVFLMYLGSEPHIHIFFKTLLQSFDCGGGKVIYHLFPDYGIYTTHHSSCSATSCGAHAHCFNGDCTCDDGFLVPDDFLPTGDLYGCSDFNPNILKTCQADLTIECTVDLLNDILNSTVEELPREIVENYLNTTMYLTAWVVNDSMDHDQLMSYGNALLDANEKLVSTLVRKTDSYRNISFSVQNLEVRVLTVGPNAQFSESLQVITSNVSMDIDLIGISNNNMGSAAVVFMSYTDMDHVLKPSFFHTAASATISTMMSTIVSVTLPKTSSPHLTSPVSLTFKHIDELRPEGVLSCVYWKTNEWVEDGCAVTKTNSTHTACSCDHLSTFALILQTESCMTFFQIFDSLGLAMELAFVLEIVFLSLSILTFALRCSKPKLSNTALMNLCGILLLSDFIDLITEKYLCSIYLHQKLCAFLAAIRHLLALSASMWMLSEAVLIFIIVKNLTNVGSNQGEGISRKWLMAIGYLIPLVVVGVSAVVVPHGYVNNKRCRVNLDTGLRYTYKYQIILIIAVNIFLYIGIVVFMIIAVKQVKKETLQRSNSNDTKLIVSVLLKSLAQFFILGCTQMVNFLPIIDLVVHLVFFFIGLQQGVFIFLVHCLLNQEVRQQYRTFLCTVCRFKIPDATADLQQTQRTVPTITS